MKKQLILLAAILAMASSTPAWAYTFSAVAPSGQTLYYDIVSGTAQVTLQYSISPSYLNLTGALTIPSSVTYNGTTYPVTSIDESAFYGCTGLTSVTIPASVTSIGNAAFYYCSGLTSVTIPNSVTSIGDDAFYNVRHIEYYGSATGSPWGAISMNGVTEGDFVYSDSTKRNLVGYVGNGGDVIIPSNVETIGEATFFYCTSLTSVTIPNSVTSIGNESFSGCSGLTSVTIGNSVTSIGSAAFNHCTSLTSVTIPNSVTSIGGIAFSYCSGLTSVTIPNSVTWIDYRAFSHCTSLTSVTIPNSVSGIGDYAFYGCSGLTSFTIGSGVTSIGVRALGGCTGLRNIISKAVYPPTADSTTFEGLPANCTLTVPCGSLTYYNGAEPWNWQFTNMEEDCNPDGIDDTEIGDVMVYAANGMIYISSTLPTETTIFDITGHQVASVTAEAASIPLPTGVYLVKIGAYPARKVVVIR